MGVNVLPMPFTLASIFQGILHLGFAYILIFSYSSSGFQSGLLLEEGNSAVVVFSPGAGPPLGDAPEPECVHVSALLPSPGRMQPLCCCFPVMVAVVTSDLTSWIRGRAKGSLLGGFAFLFRKGRSRQRFPIVSSLARTVSESHLHAQELMHRKSIIF